MVKANMGGQHGPRRPVGSLPVYNCINTGPWDISEAPMHLFDDCKPHRGRGSGLASWPPVAPLVATVGTWSDRMAVPGARVRITCVGHVPLIYEEGAVPFIMDLTERTKAPSVTLSCAQALSRL